MGLGPKELLEVHPLGKSPVITDGEVTLAESGAIIGGIPPRLTATIWAYQRLDRVPGREIRKRQIQDHFGEPMAR